MSSDGQVVIKDKDAAAPSTTDAGTLWAAAQSLRLSAQPPSFSDPARPLRSALSGSDSRLSDSDFKVVRIKLSLSLALRLQDELQQCSSSSTWSSTCTGKAKNIYAAPMQS